MTQNTAVIKLVDYSCYMQERHLRAIRSEWKDGKAPTVTVEQECAVQAESDELERAEEQNVAN